MATLETFSPLSRWRHWWQHRVLRLYPDDESAVMLRHRRIYILPTRRGLGFLFTVLLMLLMSLNYAISLGFMITFLWLGVIAVSLAHTFRNLLGLKITPLNAGHTFAGGVLPFTVALESGRYARERLLISLESAWSKAVPQADIDLPPASTRAVTLARPSVKRGRLALGRVTVMTEAPLGLWRAWSYVHFPLQGLVFPTPELAPPPLPQGVTQQQGDNAGRLGNDDLAGLREYQRGDPMQRVAWKAVARGAGWFTKAFEGGEGSHFVHLDEAALPSALGLESRLSRLTAWVLLCERSGKAFALTLPGVALPLQQGTAHCEAALTQLALFRSEEKR